MQTMMEDQVIRTPDQRLRVFVSSTLQDLAPERAAAQRAISSLCLTPVLFELGARPHPPRALYRAYLAQSHVFVGIYWQRYGWIAPGEAVSGLEDEYNLSGRLPKLIYVKSPAPERKERLTDLLGRIKADDTASYKLFSGPEELESLLTNDLALLLTERFEMTTGAPEVPAAALDVCPEATLPTVTTMLVGREREQVAVRDLLHHEHIRLVTLTGPGGIGKTRLALAVAANLHDAFAHGVAFINLAPVRDPSLLVSTVGRALGLCNAADIDLPDAIRAYLRGREMLLVLDNCEHLVDAARDLAGLLEVCPRVKVLATSREPLRLRAEHVFPVVPLGLPDPATAKDPAAVATSPAVQLFVQRAQAVSPAFELTSDNARIVAHVCRRLDGLPLAIELAAARIRALPPQAILDRLGRQLDVLRDGARDLPDRHRSLRATIDWSYDLLTEAERVLLRRLAVFVGGASLEAIEAVCAGEDVLPSDVLDLLFKLVDRSLVVAEFGSGGLARYRLLETLREYALQRLQEAGEAVAVRHRHRVWCQTLIDQAAANYWGPDLGDWLDRLECEHDNIRGALDWSEASGNIEDALRLATPLWLFFDTCGYLREGFERLERLLSLPHADERSPLVAQALTSAGYLALLVGDLATAEDRLGRSVTLWRDLGVQTGLAWALTMRGLVAYNRQDIDVASKFLEESERMARALGDRVVLGWALFGLGHVSWMRGNSRAAEMYLAETLALARAQQTHWGIAYTTFSLGLLSFRCGDLDRAEALERESLAVRWALRDKRTIVDSLGVLACIAYARGHVNQAARLFGATASLREATGASLLQSLRPIQEQTITAVYGALGDAAFATAWTEGRRMSLERVMATLEEGEL